MLDVTKSLSRDGENIRATDVESFISARLAIGSAKVKDSKYVSEVAENENGNYDADKLQVRLYYLLSMLINIFIVVS